MKKRSYSLICLTMALLMTASCGGGTATTDTTAGDVDTTTEAPEYDRIAELGAHDFGGDTFTILDQGADPNVNTPDETLEGDVINDTIAKRDSLIADMYNVKIEYVKADYAERCTMVRNSVLSGDNTYDLLYGPILDQISKLATEGILADLCSVEELSLDQSWWSPLIYENLRLGGKMYYTIGDISPISYRAPAVYYVNETLLENYSIDKNEVYDHVENGTWTLDVLAEYTKDLSQDLNQDGRLYTDDDFFGALNEDNNLSAACFATAAGVNLSTIADDSIVIDLTNEHVVNVVDKLSGLISSAKRSGNPALHTAFMESRAMFMMHFASSGYTRYRGLDFNYLTIPLPKYDDNQETYRSMINTWTNSCICIPTTADLDRAGVIVEAMAFWSQKNLRPVAYDIALKEKGSRNDRDAVMLDIIMETRYVDFNAIMEFGGSLNPLSNAIFQGASYVSGAESVKESANAEAEEFVTAWLNEQ